MGSNFFIGKLEIFRNRIHILVFEHLGVENKFIWLVGRALERDLIGSRFSVLGALLHRKTSSCVLGAVVSCSKRTQYSVTGEWAHSGV